MSLAYRSAKRKNLKQNLRQEAKRTRYVSMLADSFASN